MHKFLEEMGSIRLIWGISDIWERSLRIDIRFFSVFDIRISFHHRLHYKISRFDEDCAGQLLSFLVELFSHADEKLAFWRIESSIEKAGESRLFLICVLLSMISVDS